MRFNFDSLVPSKNDTSLSIEDAIAAECMMVRTIDEAEDAIRQAEEIVGAISTPEWEEVSERTRIVLLSVRCSRRTVPASHTGWRRIDCSHTC